MCRNYVSAIDELLSPIDCTNRFINLALQSLDENSQGRQFLLESKQGIRRTTDLIKRLNIYTRKLEKEINQISSDNE